MSSTIIKAFNLVNTDKYPMGNLNNWDSEVVNQGALVAEDVIGNFSVVNLDFDPVTGERICNFLTDQTKKGYLIAAVEDYLSDYGENIGNFFNARDERARIVILKPTMTRFDVSNFILDDTSTNAKPIANNMPVFWDITANAYRVCNGATVNAEYATAGNQFIVVNPSSAILDYKYLIRLETVK